MFDGEPGRSLESSGRQSADDRRIVDELGLASVVYGWGDGASRQPLTFQLELHVWELYRVPEEAEAVARSTLEQTTRRCSHWVFDWPGREQVLLRRPPTLEVPLLRGWLRSRGQRELDRCARSSAETVARLDERLERDDVLEPLYVERARLGDPDWRRAVALLSGGGHVAVFPCDWYAFVVSDFIESCAEAVRRER